MLRNSETRETIRKNLNKYIKATTTQAQIAKDMGVSKQRLNNWLTGVSSIDLESLSKICDLLGVGINSMFELEEKYKFECTKCEVDIITNYRELTEEDKECFKVLLEFKTSQKKLNAENAG